MKQKAYKWLLLVAAIVLLLNFVLAGYIVNQQSKEKFALYASIISKTEGTSPEATQKVLESIKYGGDTQKGAAILKQYGYTDTNMLNPGEQTAMQGSVFALFTVSSAVLLTLVCVFIILDRRKTAKDAQLLGKYIDSILQDNYDLDIRDNSEGQLSLLKNQVYKVTVKLKEQSEKLQEEQNSLKDTLANISHQIKTPLTSLLVMNELMLEDLDKEQRKEFAKSSQMQLERIKWLIETLLKLAKFDANTIELKKETVNLKKLIEASIEPVLIPMELRNQTLLVYGDDVSTMEADFNWTSEAITNILKNCTEHTNDGGTLQIEYKDNPLYVQITIEDNGKGISPKELPHIFKRFYRGEHSSTNSVGIGLALAQTIVQHQNGEIKAKSELGKGTVFTITLYKSVI